MTDSETPEIRVVDRRRAAPDGSGEPETDSTGPAVPFDAEETSPEADASDAPDYGAEGGAPNPAMLLSFAALQMDLPSLMRTLTAVFDGHAWRALGLIADPATGETNKDLPAAQRAIDCVQFLLGKLDAELSDAERRELQRRLNDLRMNYLAKLREG